MHGTISLRETRHFVGTYQHLDRWLDIGRYTILAESTVDHNSQIGDDGEYDICEPRTTTMLVCVQTDEPQPVDRIVRALDETFTQHDCHHEHDCCGCRSYSAQALHLGAGHYKVEVGSSRNY